MFCNLRISISTVRSLQWKSAQYRQCLMAVKVCRTSTVTTLTFDCSKGLHNTGSHHSSLWLQWKFAQHWQSPLWSLTAVKVYTTLAIMLWSDCSESLHNIDNHRSDLTAVKVCTILAISACFDIGNHRSDPWLQWKSAENINSHHSDLWLQWKSAQHQQSPL